MNLFVYTLWVGVTGLAIINGKDLPLAATCLATGWLAIIYAIKYIEEKV